MEYKFVEIAGFDEVVAVINGEESSPEKRRDAVLSAIYHLENLEISGDILIHVFNKADDEEKDDLLSLFSTFYQIRGTTYRIDESISILEDFSTSYANAKEFTDEEIEALKDFKQMFG